MNVFDAIHLVSETAVRLSHTTFGKIFFVLLLFMLAISWYLRDDL